MKRKNGFTLIELIVVLAILAVIAAIAIPTAFGSIEKAHVAADKASIEALNSAIRMAAVIEKANNALDFNNSYKIGDACKDAHITATAGMLSHGYVQFIEATPTEIAHFKYSTVPVAILPGTNQYTKGTLWRTVYGPPVDKLFCNYVSME
ncbi:MAG: prepilin-type N-terminal cleavage/methylation domain-containing protein [Ruthenibacterium sp.]